MSRNLLYALIAPAATVVLAPAAGGAAQLR